MYAFIFKSNIIEDYMKLSYYADFYVICKLLVLEHFLENCYRLRVGRSVRVLCATLPISCERCELY